MAEQMRKDVRPVESAGRGAFESYMALLPIVAYIMCPRRGEWMSEGQLRPFWHYLTALRLVETALWGHHGLPV